MTHREVVSASTANDRQPSGVIDVKDTDLSLNGGWPNG